MNFGKKKNGENRESTFPLFILLIVILSIPLFVQPVEHDVEVIGIAPIDWEYPPPTTTWENTSTIYYGGLIGETEPFAISDVNFSHVEDDRFSLSFRVNHHSIFVVVNMPGYYNYEYILHGPSWTDYDEYFYINEDPGVLFFIVVDVYNATEYWITDEPQDHIQLNMSAMIPLPTSYGVVEWVDDDEDIPWWDWETVQPIPIDDEEAAFNEFVSAVIIVIMFIVLIIVIFYPTPQEKKRKERLKEEKRKEYKTRFQFDTKIKAAKKGRKASRKLDRQMAKLADKKALSHLDSVSGWRYSLPFARLKGSKKNYRKTYKKLRKECSEVREIKRLHELAKQTMQQGDEKKAEWAFLKMCDMKHKMDKMMKSGQNESCAKFAALRKELVEMKFDIPEEL